ncbi:MAG: methyl-accepting chemotaxis protein, partial [Tepidisphaeraceae bacterium]
MRLHTKLSLVLLAGLLLVVSLVQSFQYVGVISRIAGLTEADLKVLRDREDENAMNMCNSIEHSVAGSLERGEMQKFSKLVDEQRKAKGLIEFSLYDRDGIVSHSSRPDALKRAMPADIRAKVAADNREIVQRTSEEVRLYRPQTVTADCVRCHTTWKAGENGGTNYFAFSTAALAKAEMDAAATIAGAKHEVARNSLLAIVGVVAVLAVSVYLLVSRLIGRPLGLFTPLLRQFETGHGDLTQRIPLTRKDEIGQLATMFNGFLADLDTAVSQAQTTARTVGQGASSQARAVEETSSAMTEISATTKRNSEHAASANELMRMTQKDINEANQSMELLANAMGAIADAGNRVVKITRTVDEIATKTNLLAINAAVEAARAGQAGAGFAVVAGDVRNLARQSATAAATIAQLIEESVNRISAGSELVKRTTTAFGSVAKRGSAAAELLEQIAHLSREQTQGIDHISQALAGIDQASQQSASQAETLLTAMAAFRT